MKKKDTSLTTYQQRRNFTHSLEPVASKQNNTQFPDQLFVVQKHYASHKHYDFRLRIGNVLVSWAVPKGPSFNSHDKRLAVHTEDHPLAYAYFEGTIPQEEYGGGTVMVWDIGTFKHTTTDNGKKISLRDAFNNGKIEVFLEGKRLKGGYVLIKFKEEQDQWLFKKIDDEYVKASTIGTYRTSVLSGRTMQEIAADKPARK